MGLDLGKSRNGQILENTRDLSLRCCILLNLAIHSTYCRNFFKQVCCTSSNFLFVFEYVGWKEGQQKKKDAAAKRKADDGGSKGGKKANAGGEGAEENKENDDEVQEVQDDDEIQEVPA